MAPLSTMTRALARSASLRLPVRAMSSTPALAAGASSSFESPFKGAGKSTKVPDFSKYMSKGSGNTNALFSYFMVGTLGAISAAGAKSTIQGEFFWVGWDGVGASIGLLEGRGGLGYGNRNRNRG